MIEPSGALGDEKHCVVCGRRFGWRRRWEREWDRIQHCSKRCGRRRLTATDARLEQAILALLSSSGTPLISPNDAARTIGKGWRALSERARDAARRLSAQGRVSFVQGGREVDASSAKGPVQLRLRRS
ncbi:MAG: DUF3253 domain-containing protein [Planctomycetota bacterium]